MAGSEFLVFGVTLGGDPIACPSLAMAYEVAARWDLWIRDQESAG